SMAAGALIMAAGLLLLKLIIAHLGVAGNTILFVPALLIDGAGMGMVMAPLISTVLACISPRHAGAASGVLAAMQQVGNAVGVAIIGVVFYGALGSGRRGAFADAFGAGLIYLIALAIAVALLLRLLPRRT
ncbi:MAG: MFS transporter, partial [Dehalococcoidia bacterium]